MSSHRAYKELINLNPMSVFIQTAVLWTTFAAGSLFHFLVAMQLTIADITGPRWIPSIGHLPRACLMVFHIILLWIGWGCGGLNFYTSLAVIPLYYNLHEAEQLEEQAERNTQVVEK